MSRPATGGAATTALLLLIALVAFAGNSLLNRAALAGGAIGWGDFTAIRLGSGALFLVLLIAVRKRRPVLPKPQGLLMPAALFVYAALFSWAYLALSAATGALILFALVQLSMQALGIVHGQYPTSRQWLGLAIAFAGLVWLLLPGLAAPPLGPAAAMAGAGIAWGVYSWLGREVADPVVATAGNFAASLPLVLLMLLVIGWQGGATIEGIALAIASGAFASGLGYVVWYAVLPRISNSTAAVGQLSVPAIAALGGVLLLGEALSERLIASTIVILAGIALTIGAKKPAKAA